MPARGLARQLESGICSGNIMKAWGGGHHSSS
jgi:hypothetical protein